MTFAHYTLFSAIAISLVAAFYSITGLVAIFPGAALSIILMGLVLENGKLVAAAWLHRNWDYVTAIKKPLIAFVAVLMLITSLGIYGFLSKAHLETTGQIQTVQIEQQFIQEQLDQVKADRARQQQILSQIDNASEAYLARGSVTRAVRLQQSSSEQRTAVIAEIQKLNKQETDLNRQKAELTKQSTSVAAEVGPIKYIAALIYGQDQATDSIEKAVQIVLLLLVFVFDPLAVALLIAAQISFQQQRVTATEPPVVPQQSEGSVSKLRDRVRKLKSYRFTGQS